MKKFAILRTCLNAKEVNKLFNSLYDLNVFRGGNNKYQKEMYIHYPRFDDDVNIKQAKMLSETVQKDYELITLDDFYNRRSGNQKANSTMELNVSLEKYGEIIYNIKPEFKIITVAAMIESLGCNNWSRLSSVRHPRTIERLKHLDLIDKWYDCSESGKLMLGDREVIVDKQLEQVIIGCKTFKIETLVDIVQNDIQSLKIKEGVITKETIQKLINYIDDQTRNS